MKESLQTAFDQSQQISKDVENIQSRIDHGIDILLSNKPTIKENLQIVIGITKFRSKQGLKSNLQSNGSLELNFRLSRRQI